MPDRMITLAEYGRQMEARAKADHKAAVARMESLGWRLVHNPRGRSYFRRRPGCLDKRDWASAYLDLGSMELWDDALDTI